MCLREHIHQLARDVKQQLNKEVVVFIDTNPALSITTQIALVAMTHLIIAVNADSFSMQVGCLRDCRCSLPFTHAHIHVGAQTGVEWHAPYHCFGRALTASVASVCVHHLPAGYTEYAPLGVWAYPCAGPAREFEANTFASKARSYQLPLPKIAAIINNRRVQVDRLEHTSVSMRARRAEGCLQCGTTKTVERACCPSAADRLRFCPPCLCCCSCRSLIVRGDANQAGKAALAYRALASSHAGLLFDGYKKAAELNELDKVFKMEGINGGQPFNDNQIVQFSEAYSGTMRDMCTTGVAALTCGFPVYLIGGKQSVIRTHCKVKRIGHGAVNNILQVRPVVTRSTDLTLSTCQRQCVVCVVLCCNCNC